MNKIFTLILFFFSFASFAQIKDNRIYFEVDEIAKYQGGYNNFNKYISESINCKIKINKKKKTTFNSDLL